MRFFFLFLAYFGLFFSISNNCQAQLRRVYIVPSNDQLKLNYEGDFSPHYSLPLGISKNTNPQPDKAAGGLNGWGLELRLQHRIRKNALWAVGFCAGWVGNDYNQQSLNQFIQNQPNNSQEFLQTAAGKNWQRVYFVPHISFRGGVKRKFELSAGLGVGQSRGGFYQKQYLNGEKTLLLRQTWTHQAPLTAVSRISLLFGQTLGKYRQWLLFAQSSILHTSGTRKAVLVETRHRWDNLNQTAQEEVFNGQFKVQNPFQFSSLQLSLGLRYQFYKTLYPHTRTKDGIIYH